RLETGWFLEERRDVEEVDARLRKVRDAANHLFQIDGQHQCLIAKPVRLPVGSSSITVTCCTRPPGGPVRSARSTRVTASSSPSTNASTRPSSRFITHPATPSRIAASCTNQRKPTPCTRPLMTNRRAMRMSGKRDYIVAFGSSLVVGGQRSPIHRAPMLEPILADHLFG